MRMQLDRLLESASSQAPVAGLTHGFYRYPARFSPEFARAAIEEFTEPQDTVLDPFMGGGTSAVEALSLGRRFVGGDLNSLSVFITRTKTTPLSLGDEKGIADWGTRLSENGQVRSWNFEEDEWASYQVNTPWWIRRAIALGLSQSENLKNQRQRYFARAVMLKKDRRSGRSIVKSISQQADNSFVALQKNALEMLYCMRTFKDRVCEALSSGSGEVSSFRRLITCDAAHLSNQKRIPGSWLPPETNSHFAAVFWCPHSLPSMASSRAA